MSGDSGHLRPSKAHVPLTWMLVLTQLGVGLSVMDAWWWTPDPTTAIFALGATVTGLIAGTLHLGQPLKAWRAFLGWRNSWLSRELIAFGVFTGVLALQTAIRHPGWSLASALSGLVAVYCSVMVYVDTKRPFWGTARTFMRFAITTALLGMCGVVLTKAWAWAFPGILLLTLAKLAVELSVFTHLRGDPTAPLTRSARLLLGPLKGWFALWLQAAAVGGISLPTLLSGGWMPVDPVVLGCIFACCCAGELIERHLFFLAESASKMPGGVAT